MEQKEKRHILTGGMILITLGVLIILHNTTSYDFALSWPILLIVVAVGTLVQSPKDIGGWIIGVVGIIFLLKETWQVNISSLAVYLMPLLLILLGIHVIAKQKQNREP